MSTEGSGASRAGGDGFHNEDAFRVHEGLGLYLVCDGASGKPAGEVASRVASEAIAAFVADSGDRLGSAVREEVRATVADAMTFALSAVAEAERVDPALRGLATTVTVLLVHGDLGVIGHWGDSRAYLIRRDRAHQLTVDHELTEARSPVEGDASAFDVFAVELRSGDTILLCTDGAEDVVRDDDLVRVAGELAPRLLASRIVSAAHRRAPEQDATVVAVRVRGDRESGWLELSQLPRGTAFGHTLQLAGG